MRAHGLYVHAWLAGLLKSSYNKGQEEEHCNEGMHAYSSLLYP